MTIIADLPNTITNGQANDAGPLMANLLWILSQTNANAAGNSVNNNFSVPQSGVSGNVAASFPILSQIQSNSATWCGTSGGTSTAITLTPSPPITSYKAGQTFIFNAQFDSTSGGTTVAVSGLSTLTLQSNALPIATGDIKVSKYYVVLVDDSGTTAQLISMTNFFPGSLLGMLQINTSTALSVLATGKMYLFTGANSGQTLTLPAIATVGIGKGFWIVNAASVPVTLQGNGAEAIFYSIMGSARTNANILVLNPGDSGFYITNGSSYWQEVYGVRAANIVGGVPQIQTVGCTVPANVLTPTLSPTVLDFRSTTATSGAISRAIQVPAALSLTVPTTSSLGAITATQTRFALLAINNSGTVELAISNLAGGVNLDETGVINTTSLGGSSNSATVIYSTTGRSNVPYRVVGFMDATWTSGTGWTLAAVQGIGGQALAAMSSLGYGQTWQNVIGSRSVGTTYYNVTGKPIQLSISMTQGTFITGRISLTINGSLMAQQGPTSGSAVGDSAANIMPIIPAGNSYSVTISGGAISYWWELR